MIPRWRPNGRGRSFGEIIKERLEQTWTSVLIWNNFSSWNKCIKKKTRFAQSFADCFWCVVQYLTNSCRSRWAITSQQRAQHSLMRRREEEGWRSLLEEILQNRKNGTDRGPTFSNHFWIWCLRHMKSSSLWNKQKIFNLDYSYEYADCYKCSVTLITSTL